MMMLWSPDLAVVPITIHIPLRDVAEALTPELIVSTARIVADDLKQRFKIARPRLVLAGLNPHAGEHGSIGTESSVNSPTQVDRWGEQVYRCGWADLWNEEDYFESEQHQGRA